MIEATAGHCWQCGSPLTQLDFGRESYCPRCGKPTHVCRNCRLFAANRHNGCLEPIAEPVTDKTRANFCGYFEPAARPGIGPRAKPNPADLLKTAQALFK
jgi:predicted RNA-binding Zn-ribbon protein involved in translation (DUF1610 family)